MTRAFLGGLSLASILFAPLWIPIIFMAALAARFLAWEILFLGAIIDVLYVPPGGFFGIPVPATLLAFLLLMAFEPIRQKLLI